MVARHEVQRRVIEAVKMVQEASGRSVVTLSAETSLFDDVEGFDSLNALEVVVQVSEDLGVEIPDEAVFPTKSSSTSGTPLTIKNLVDRILAHIEESADVHEASGSRHHG